MEDKHHRLALKEIVDGFSAYFVGEKKVYIKHQSLSDVVDFEMVYDLHFEKAQKRGLPTKKEIFENLTKEGIWTSADDAKIEKHQFYVESLIKNKKNLYLKSATERINAQIKDAEQELSTMLMEKEELSSNCCDHYATNRANDFYMFSSFFKDPELTAPLYTQEEFEYIEATKVTEIIRVYNKFHERFSEKNIQNLVLQGFYKIYYSFSESCVDFFGIPVVKLNNFQLNLLIYTRIFKNIFDQHDDIPERIRDDPAALLDYAGSSNAREELKQKMSAEAGTASSIVGATKEDLEELGLVQESGKTLSSAAESKGGSLSMKDLMDLSGV